MDFALWDPSDYQDENNYYIDDYWHCDFYSGCGHDAIEEDALNEKSCVQVLGILVKKADEEIMELEADAVILLSQLTWADKDWSDLCSATLREKIDHLDISVQSLKMEIAGDENFLGVELLKNKKPAERLHDIVKPLWDSCFPLIQKQKSSAERLATRNSEEKALSNFKLVGCSIEVPEKIIRPLPVKPAQKADVEIRDKEGDAANSFVNAHTYATEKNINHLNGQSGTQKPSSAPDKVKKRRNPTKSEKLQNALVKDSSASTYEEKAGSKGRKKKRNIDIEVIFEEQVIECSFTDKSKVLNSSLESPGMGTKIAEMVKPADTILDSRLDAMKQVTEDSSCIQKARKEVADMKKIDSRTQLQKERKRTNVCGRTKISEVRAAETELTISGILLELCHRKRKCATKPQMKVKQIPQAKEVMKIEEVVVDQSKSNSLSEPEVQTLERKCQEIVIFQEPCLSEEIDLKSSSIDKFKSQQKIGISENIASNQLGVCSEVSASSISQPQKKKKVSLSSPVENKEQLRIVPFKLEKLHDDKSDRTMDDQDVKSLSRPASSIENVKGLTVKDLRFIAKSQKMPRYYKLRKEELREHLGL